MDELGLVSLVDTDAIHEPSLVPLDPNEGILSDSLASTPLVEPIASSLPQEDAKIDEGDAVIPRTQSGKREKTVTGRFNKTGTHPDLLVPSGRSLRLKAGLDGWRMAYANVSARPGLSYFEAKIASNGNDQHARFGWASIKPLKKKARGKEAIKEAPEEAIYMSGNVGYDAGAYGYSNVTGKVFNERKGKNYGAPWTNNDVIGCAIIMSDSADRADLYFFKNGQPQGLAVSNVSCKAPWYPAVSLFGLDTLVETNFGPKFEFEPFGLPENPLPAPIPVAIEAEPIIDQPTPVAAEPEEKRAKIDPEINLEMEIKDSFLTIESRK